MKAKKRTDCTTYFVSISSFYILLIEQITSYFYISLFSINSHTIFISYYFPLIDTPWLTFQMRVTNAQFAP